VGDVASVSVCGHESDDVDELLSELGVSHLAAEGRGRSDGNGRKGRCD
jgi:hypothetical protein